ncbi:hypothetical protein HJG60_011745 [Phyllostomus discolor]|uniref:Uncharacterized protein n=1 Tax=Phyllostomus discolor TaxID=89673 RepID=A0A833ZW04_9CHIR|nr:hypothetical protein HJG60_011745 [Phyllostomus discolor]
MTKNFPNLVREKGTQVQEAHRVPTKIGPKRPTTRHIIIKTAQLKEKERLLKAARVKQLVTKKGDPIKLPFDVSTETFQARRDWHEIFKVMKIKDLQPRLIYSARVSFKIEGEKRVSHTRKS